MQSYYAAVAREHRFWWGRITLITTHLTCAIDYYLVNVLEKAQTVKGS